MAFTPYKTWSVGETLTAANFNQQIRDNGLAMGPHLIVRKTSDESRTSDTTFSNDATLQLPVAASEIWQAEFGLVFLGGAGNLKIQFTFPTGGTCSLAVTAKNAAGTVDDIRFLGTTSPSTSGTIFTDTQASYIGIRGVYVNGGTGGTVIMQWAQNTSSATPTTIKANSTLWGVKLA